MGGTGGVTFPDSPELPTTGRYRAPTGELVRLPGEYVFEDATGLYPWRDAATESLVDPSESLIVGAGVESASVPQPYSGTDTWPDFDDRAEGRGETAPGDTSDVTGLAESDVGADTRVESVTDVLDEVGNDFPETKGISSGIIGSVENEPLDMSEETANEYPFEYGPDFFDPSRPRRPRVPSIELSDDKRDELSEESVFSVSEFDTGIATVDEIEEQFSDLEEEDGALNEGLEGAEGDYGFSDSGAFGFTTDELDTGTPGESLDASFEKLDEKLDEKFENQF